MQAGFILMLRYNKGRNMRHGKRVIMLSKKQMI